MLGMWPIIGLQSGKVHSMAELLPAERIGDKLKTFPTSGELSWKKYPERPRRIRVKGIVDVEKFYLWVYGFKRPRGDTGMASIVKPHPSEEIGDTGDRFYEFDGISGSYKYDGIVILNGRFQIDIWNR